MNKKEVAEMAVIKQQVKGIDDRLKTHCTEQREDFNKVFELLENLSGKFAGKWVEKYIIGISIGLTVAIVGGIITLIITNVFGG